MRLSVSIITNFLWPEVDDLKENGVRNYTTYTKLNILHKRFEDDIAISHGNDMNWTSRSCDLSSLDFGLYAIDYYRRSAFNKTMGTSENGTSSFLFLLCFKVVSRNLLWTLFPIKSVFLT